MCFFYILHEEYYICFTLFTYSERMYVVYIFYSEYQLLLLLTLIISWISDDVHVLSKIRSECVDHHCDARDTTGKTQNLGMVHWKKCCPAGSEQKQIGSCQIHGSLNVPIEHHPTNKGIWSTRWLLFQVMSNIPKMGHLPTPEIPGWKNKKKQGFGRQSSGTLNGYG